MVGRTMLERNPKTAGRKQYGRNRKAVHQNIYSSPLFSMPSALQSASQDFNQENPVCGGQSWRFQDVNIRYSNGAVVQRQPVHASFKSRSYRHATSSRLKGRALALQRLGASDPDVLRAALVEDSGVPDSNVPGSDARIDYEIPNQAHHIVESHGGDDVGRDILSSAGIHINSAINGVLLPTWEGDNTGNATVHLGSHVEEYSDCVNAALQEAVADEQAGTRAYKQAVKTVLSTIREILLNHNLALNAHGDPDYNPDTEQPVSITEIFEQYGLI